MKKILIVLAILLPLIAGAIEPVQFRLTPAGLYETSTGEDFIIVPFEGKSAAQIHEELIKNMHEIYGQDFDRFVHVNDGNTIGVRALGDSLYVSKVFGVMRSWEGYYRLQIRIREGRIRLNAPRVESVRMVGGPDETWKFSKQVGKWFRDSKIKDNDREKYELVVDHMNLLVNRIIIGPSWSPAPVEKPDGKSSVDNDDNW